MTLFILLILFFLFAFIGIQFWQRPRIGLRSCYSLFFVVWAYYGLAVPFDLLLGVHLSKPELDRLPNLNLPQATPLIVSVLLYYLLCAAVFWLGYQVVPLQRTAWQRRRKVAAARLKARLANRPFSLPPAAAKQAPTYKRYGIRPLPLWLLLACNLLVLLLYLISADAWEFDRQARSLLSGQQPIFKIYTFLTTVAYALNLLMIWVSDSQRQAIPALLLGVLLGAITGGRSWMVFFPLLYVVRFGITLRRRRFIVLLTAGFLFALLWKGIYFNLLSWYQGEAAQFWQTAVTTQFEGLSGLEAITSFRIFAAFLARDSSPLWLGSSYIQIPLQITLPRFLSDSPVQTLAEIYIRQFHPAKATWGGGLGFSALAESWLNFGTLGPALLGFVWAVVAKFLDNRPRGITFLIFFMMTFRLFRSDFASLYKSWIVLLGGSLWLILALLWLVQHRSLRPARKAVQLPKPARQRSTV